MTLEIFSQVMIFFTGVVAVGLTQLGNEKWRPRACFFGLAGQPFWLYPTYQSEQVGMFLISIIYTMLWTAGCIKFFKTRKR